MQFVKLAVLVALQIIAVAMIGHFDLWLCAALFLMASYYMYLTFAGPEEPDDHDN
jgi:hypothetical protein